MKRDGNAAGRRCLIAMAVVMALALGTAGCRTGDGGSTGAPSTAGPVTPRTGGALVYAIDADPNGFDPARNTWETSGLQVASAIFDTWTAFGADGTAQPYLAQSIEHDAGFRSWTVRLRPGIRFHDGQPLDAAAAVTNLEALRASAVTGAPLGNIASVTPVDGLTFTVAMVQPWAAFPSMLTGQAGTVAAPSQLVDDKGSERPIGTGPFKLAAWDIDQRTEVVRNDDYWRAGLPYLDKVVFEVMPDGQQRVARLATGDVDVTTVAQAADVAAMEALEGDGVVVEHDTGPTEPTFLMFNVDRAPFDDLRMRRALAHATDVAALARAANWPTDHLAHGPFAASSPWFAPTDYPPYDVAQARALVDAYRADGGNPAFTITGSYAPEIVQLLADQWADAGLDVSVNLIDPKRFALISVLGDYQVTYMQYFASPDPDTLWHFWSSTTTRPTGAISINLSRFADAEVDEGLDLGRHSDDVAVRRQGYEQVQQRFAAQLPYLWLYHVDWAIGRRSGVHDARNVTLPGGAAAMPYTVGVHRLTETWVE